MWPVQLVRKDNIFHSFLFNFCTNMRLLIGYTKCTVGGLGGVEGGGGKFKCTKRSLTIRRESTLHQFAMKLQYLNMKESIICHSRFM